MAQETFDARADLESVTGKLPATLPDLWQPFLEAVSAWNAKLWLSAASANGEYLNFLNKRAKADLIFTQSLTGCKSPADVWRTYSEFLACAANDYREGLNDLTSRWKAVTEESTTALVACADSLQRTDVSTDLAA
jgi:hypothetical protein